MISGQFPAVVNQAAAKGADYSALARKRFKVTPDGNG